MTSSIEQATSAETAPATVEGPTSTTLTLTAGQIHRLFGRALRFVSTHRSNPLLAAVELRAEGHAVTATATDRFALGRSRVRLPETDPPLDTTRVVIVAADLRLVLDMFPIEHDQEETPRARSVPRDLPVEITVAGNAVRFSGAGRTYTAQVTITETWVDTDALLAPALERARAGEPGVPSIRLDPHLFGKFAHLGEYPAEPVQVYLPDDPEKPILVTAADFVGMQMPIRVKGDTGVGVDTWAVEQLPAVAVEPTGGELVPASAVAEQPAGDLTGLEYVQAFAPWPTDRRQVTADVMLRNLLAASQHFAGLSSEESRAAFGLSDEERNTPEGRNAMKVYTLRLHAMVADFSSAFLLRTLMRIAPGEAEKAARELWDMLDAGDSIGELTWEWLEALGLDPDRAGPPCMVVGGEMAPTATKITAEPAVQPEGDRCEDPCVDGGCARRRGHSGGHVAPSAYGDYFRHADGELPSPGEVSG